MAFEPFDLGRVIQTAEAIKGIRRQEETDKLRDAYLGQQMQIQKQQADTEKMTQDAKHDFLAAQAIETAPDPLSAARQLAPKMIQEFEKAHGPGAFDNLPADLIRQFAAMGKERAAAQAGINLQPDANVTAAQKFKRESDATDFNQQQQLAKTQHGYRLDEIAATSRVKPGNAFRAMSAQEIAAAGLPPGTSAQIDETTGKIDVLTKRDTTSSLSQKDMTTAKMKLNTVSLARQQLNRIRQQFEAIKGTLSAGPESRVMGLSAGSQKFDAAVNQMRSTLTALTRVPGVGAMSDYETKLDQSKFPDRLKREEVTQQQIDDVDNMLNAIETGYKDLLSGSSASPQQTPQPQADPLGIR